MSGSRSVSVVVCTRNRPAVLRRCLATLERCTPRPDEILVMDQSDPAEVAASRAACPPGVAFVNVAPRGLGFSRAEAVSRVRSDLVAFIDDDCKARADWIAAILDAFARHPEAGAVTGASRPDPEEALPPGVPEWVTDWGEPATQVYRRPVDPFEIGRGLNMSFRVDALRAIGNFDPLLGVGGPLASAEDADILHRLLRAGWPVVYTPDAVVSHYPPRGLGDHERNDYLYAHGLGAWAARRWRTGDRFPARVWLRTFGRNLYYLVRRAPWESLRFKRHRVRVARHLLAGWAPGWRSGRGPDAMAGGR